jgi:Flp pilus assembly pilin Flp
VTRKDFPVIPASLAPLVTWLRSRYELAHRDERGIETIEWVIIAAIAAGLAIAVGAVIVSKVTGKANSINLG